MKRKIAIIVMSSIIISSFPVYASSNDSTMESESIKEDIIPEDLPDEEYKEKCTTMWYDDIFFSDDNLKGKLVKLDLFIEEYRVINSKEVYDTTTTEFINTHDLQRDLYRCGVKRENEDSYAGGQIDMFFSNKYDCNPSDYCEGDHITIYGEIIDYSTWSWNGYNSCSIIPRFIEKQ